MMQVHAPGRYIMAEPHLIVRAGIIAHVIAMPHEGIDRAHGITLRLLKQQERVIEILSSLLRDLATVAIRLFDTYRFQNGSSRGRHRSKISTRSAFETDGRWANTLYSCWRILSRIFMPPRLNNSRSSARRRLTVPISGR